MNQITDQPKAPSRTPAASRVGRTAKVLSTAAMSCLAMFGVQKAQATTTDYSIGLNFATDRSASTLAATEQAGVVKQANWNNFANGTGEGANLTADNQNAAQATTASVAWASVGTWASTGAGEENNTFPAGPDRKLTTGYLDTGDATTTTVTISGIPTQLTSRQYDVYVYILGGVAGRGGGYRITDDQGTVLRGYKIGDSPANPSTYIEDPGVSHSDRGTHLVFRNLSAPSIIVEATTMAPYGVVRAPVNAIQLVASATKDTSGPLAASLVPGADLGRVTVTFNEPIDRDTALDATRYSISGGLTISEVIAGNADPDAMLNSVTLVTSAQTSGTTYTVTINGVRDAVGNANANVTGTFRGAVLSTGGLKVELYRNISGTSVDLLTGDARYPASPDETFYWPNFGPFAAGNNYGDNYGAQIEGWIIPPATGQYKFFLRSDDASQLFLSTDATPENAVLVAQQVGCCNPFTAETGTVADPTATGLSSTPITLTGGQRYYVLALLKEGGGDDYLQVAWRTPNDPDINSTSGLQSIPGQFLQTFIDPAFALNITQQLPATATVNANNSLNLSVGFSATSGFGTNATVQYQFAPAGSTTFTNITGANSPNFSIANIQANQAGQYRAVVNIGTLGSVTSSVTSVTVNADATPPSIASAEANSTFNGITVKFSEPVTAASAGNQASYSLSGGLTVTSVQVVDGTTVRLVTSAQTPSSTYTLTIRDIRDAANLGTSPNPATISVNSFLVQRGFVRHDFFENVGGNIAGLTNDLRYPNNPTSTTFEPRVEFPRDGGGEGGSNYGNKLSGLLVPPETGAYVFYVSSDDPSQLFLSTDADPANAVLIAAEPQWNNPRTWTGTDRRDATNPQNRSDTYLGSEWANKNADGLAEINLVAGQRYYFHILHTEGGGGDNVGMIWRLPSQTEDPANGTPALSGAFVENTISPVGASVNITQQPAPATVTQGRTATFTVAATGTPNTSGVTYQWQQAAPGGQFVNIAGATGATFTTSGLTLAQNGTRYRVIVSVPGATATSNEATATVNADQQAPVITSVFRSFSDPAVVVVTFSELVTAASSTAAANYALSNGLTVSSAAASATNPNAVELTLSGNLANGTTANLTVNNVTDMFGNRIAANTSSAVAFQRGILFINGATPSASDNAIVTRLRGQGFDVEQVTAAASGTDTAIGKDLVIISSTVNSGDVLAEYLDSDVPTISWEQALQDDFLFTGNVDGTTRGATAAQTQLDIITPAHQMAAGLSGTVTIANNPIDISWGTPGAGATVVASIVGNATRAAIYGYEKGATLIDGASIAAERRAHAFMTDNTFVNLNANGIRLFDAAVSWALGDAPAAGAPRLTITKSGVNQVTITWTGGGRLEEAAVVTGPWTPVAGAPNGTYTTATSGNTRFFRVVRP